jgi:hypothetical protein
VTVKFSKARMIAELAGESPDLAHLQAVLADRGFRFRSRRHLRRVLDRSWKRSNSAEFERVRSVPLRQPALPLPIEVVRDGVTFRVFGAAHGQRRFLRLQPEVVEQLRRLLTEGADRPSSDYATERGFARLLGLPRSKELDYMRALLRRVGVRGFIIQFGRTLVLLPLLPVAGALLAFSRDPFARAVRACLRSSEGLARAAQLWSLSHLPPRIRLELEGQTFRVLHSEEMARAMLEVARDSHLRVLTVLVGLAHADEIAYFLEAA